MVVTRLNCCRKMVQRGSRWLPLRLGSLRWLSSTSSTRLLTKNPSFSIYSDYETRSKQLKGELFHQFDQNGDGLITKRELQETLRIKDYQATAIMTNLDPEGINGGTLDYELFCKFVDNLAQFDLSDTNRAFAAANHQLTEMVFANIKGFRPPMTRTWSAALRTAKQGEKVLQIDTVNNCLRQMQYAVRGLVPMTAQRIAQELQLEETKDRYPFDEVLFCNIGNPQAVGQAPITFYREVTALCDYPALLKNPNISDLFSDASIERAIDCLEQTKLNMGAYSDSQGTAKTRQFVADFILQRDGFEADPTNIFLTNGASSGIQALFQCLIAQTSDAVMIPIPQYPIYSALATLLDGKYIGYYLEEETGWSLSLSELERSINEARALGLRPRAFAIINPGNPVGNVLSYDNLAMVIDFCKRERLVLLADEVYQENVYNPERPFVSAKKVLKEMGSQYEDVELVSYHSTSKGFIGECGRRGGYMELCGFDPEVKGQLVKLASASLCANLNGQLMTDLMVRPPAEGSDAFQLFQEEKGAILSGLTRKSKFLHAKLNEIEGVSCQPLDGAMYAFPRIELSQHVIDKAAEQGQSPDTYYALSLLESTGLCCVPGSGFGQEEDTFHLRLTFLPDEEKLKATMDRFAEHHATINAS